MNKGYNKKTNSIMHGSKNVARNNHFNSALHRKNINPQSIRNSSMMPLSSEMSNLNNTSNSNSTENIDTQKRLTIKMPLSIKIGIALMTIIISLILFIVVIFIVIFTDEEESTSSGGSVGYGNFAYGETCTTVTVTDTGCSGDATNCTNQFDGDVSLEDYIAGVIAAEIGSANNLEYYKVTAIATRTFFLSHTSSSCTVKGNASFQAYRDVEESPYSELIKQAVEETKGLVLVKGGELMGAHYASACVTNADDYYYYVRYGTLSQGQAKFQKIPKTWDETTPVYKGYLNYWYSLVDQTDTNYETKNCPSNHDYGMSQLGALYLVHEENYTYEDVLKYYYGDDLEIVENKMQLTGNSGFINPTTSINCTSPFGYRIHPVQQTEKFHSGIDIGVTGPIYAAQSGTVTKVVTNVSAINNCAYGYGNHIVIEHADGTSTLYAHIKYGTIPNSVYEGATVSQGEQIGEVGSTGCSTGYHLHYEVKLNGNNVDPADYLDLTNAKGTCRNG